ncbi:DEAD/DEAH box helicase [Mesorhizobium sp. LHD-90]|uniref:DEAD/DEAH box helicase n=1 Tax=Mesorhizobium sp. LHD-90 TaxID=3071414 RepID=UPI0027E08A04|nr:DEAD/DEAH box helicase [Mesorhizobium sp. LHD-90]MDQ6432949.1 DEAD/DEAH box helicase [Mesorhizobium sp. LHD-90]
MNTEISANLEGFASLGITGALLKATEAAGFDMPKPIQAQAIPAQLAGRDILGVAQTGSGKTAAFSLPILARISALGTKRLPRTARALILAPTRELAVQIEETIRVLAKGMHISTALVLGGVSRNSQVKRMAPGVDILIATPGRLTDLVREGEVKLGETRWLVLDEADRMLDMGFINDVKRIAKATHADRQTALFSATMPAEIEQLARGILKDPVHVEVAPQGTTAAEIKQSVVLARLKQKRKVLSTMLADPAMSSVMVFARTKHGADRVVRDLERDGFKAAVIHGNKSQNARQKALNGFRDGSMRILVATDIAARGIDVPGISHVINFDLPDEAESYVHRIGRTGRNGASGTAITLCDPNENAKLRSVERIIRMKLPVLADHLGEPDPQPEPRSHEPREDRDAARPREHHRAGRPGGDKQRQGKKPFSGKPGGKRFGGQGERFGGQGDQQRFAGNPTGEGRPAGQPNGEKRFAGKKRPFRGRRNAPRAA